MHKQLSQTRAAAPPHAGFLPRTPSVGPAEGLLEPTPQDKAPYGTIQAFARTCAQALRAAGPGEAALFLGGEALLEAGGWEAGGREKVVGVCGDVGGELEQ